MVPGRKQRNMAACLFTLVFKNIGVGTRSARQCMSLVGYILSMLDLGIPFPGTTKERHTDIGCSLGSLTFFLSTEFHVHREFRARSLVSASPEPKTFSPQINTEVVVGWFWLVVCVSICYMYLFVCLSV